MCLFVILNHFVNLKYAFLILDFMLCIVGMCEVSPKVKEQKNFLLSLLGSLVLKLVFC
jgi:hypothetical protein